MTERKKKKQLTPTLTLGRSVDVSAHGEVDEDEDVEFDEDGETEEDGVQDEASQTQSPVQSPFVQMNAKDLQKEQNRAEHDQQEKTLRVTAIIKMITNPVSFLPIFNILCIFYSQCTVFSVFNLKLFEI